jgi:hypothetical protein
MEQWSLVLSLASCAWGQHDMGPKRRGPKNGVLDIGTLWCHMEGFLCFCRSILVPEHILGAYLSCNAAGAWGEACRPLYDLDELYR